jgi:hypothetical protein
MLLPASRVAGTALGSTVNALSDILNCPIFTEVVPVFVIDTLRDTGTPTLTSPKSSVEGFTDRTDVLWLVDEKAPELEPHPARPAVIVIVANPRATARVDLDLLKRRCTGLTSGRADTTLMLEIEILQNLSIDITCIQDF